MMRMIKRIFALLLTVAMLVCMLTACYQPSNLKKANGASPAAEKTDVNTPASQKITHVNIICGKSTVENYVATEIKWYFAQKNIPTSPDGYKIEIKMDATVSQNGYRIFANENGLVLAGGNERGLAYGLYAFLEKVLGVYHLSADTTVIGDGEVVINVGVLDELTPVFDIIRNPWYPIEKLAEKNGGNVGKNDDVKIFYLNNIVENGSTPPCFNDIETLNKTIRTVKDYLLSGAEVDVLRFSPASEQDTYCTCEACSLVLENEGTPADIYVRFLNALKAEIAPRFPNVKIELVACAYLNTPPALTTLADGISVRLNTEKCHISHPVTDQSCPGAVAFATTVRGWASACNNVHVEYGLTSTVDFIPTFANLGTLRENMRFFAECGVGSISCTGNIVCPTGEFGELRLYLASKLLQNPLMSQEEYDAYMNSFLTAFYGEGWSYIRKFIDKTVELSADGHQAANGSPFDAITQEEYLENEETFDEWWDAAEAAAGERIAFVKRARYQWRYIKLCLHPNAEEAQKLIDDAKSNPRVGWREKLWNVDTQKSDLTKAPTEWVYKS